MTNQTKENLVLGTIVTGIVLASMIVGALLGYALAALMSA